MSLPERQDDAEHYKQVLRDLVDMASDIARLIQKQAHVQAETPTPNTPFPDPASAFDRIARTIRRTILLAEKLAEPPTPTGNRIAARKRILREVEDAIQLNAKPADRPALAAELLDRLDAPDLEDDIDARPLDDIIVDICHDLRVVASYNNNWKRRTPAEVEALRTRAAAIPSTWAPPPLNPQPQPARRKPPKPTLAPRHDNTETILAEYARILHNTA